MKQSSELLVESELDPLLRGAPFPYVQLYYPYGFAVELRTNSKAIVDAAGESWGQFVQEHPNPPLTLQIGVSGDEKGPLPPQPLVRAVRHMMTVTGDAEHFGVADFEAGFGFCWLTPRMLKDVAAARYFYIEALGYCLVSERYLAGIHGACVAWNGNGALLCGLSEAGKSTLAYACARRGFTYVSDDGSFLIRSAHDRVVTGNCHTIRFRPAAVELFPELRRFVAARRGNGKLAIEVATRRLSLPSTATRSRVDNLVFLNRRPDGRARLLPFSRAEALRQMQLAFPFGRDASIDEQRCAVGRLLEAEVLELAYSDLDEAVDCLESLLR